MRHAYCIIAHQDPALLRSLVSALDHPLNDIYIHLDKTADIALFKVPETRYSTVRFLENRMEVIWGNPNQIEVEYKILHEAYEGGDYSFFHILSGVDFPLKSQDYIHDFMDVQHPGTLFVSIDGLKGKELADLEYKTRYYHFFVKDLKKPDQFSLSYLIHYYCHAGLVKVQKLFGIRRKYPFELKKGANWVSIPRAFVEYLFSQEVLVKKAFRHTLCADEIFLQTIAWNSPFRNSVFNLDGDHADGNMREIDWSQNCPAVWKEKDLPRLLSCGKLFARKFSSQDSDLIETLTRSFRCQ